MILNRGELEPQRETNTTDMCSNNLMKAIMKEFLVIVQA